MDKVHITLLVERGRALRGDEPSGPRGASRTSAFSPAFTDATQLCAVGTGGQKHPPFPAVPTHEPTRTLAQQANTSGGLPASPMANFGYSQVEPACNTCPVQSTFVRGGVVSRLSVAPLAELRPLRVRLRDVGHAPVALCEALKKVERRGGWTSAGVQSPWHVVEIGGDAMRDRGHGQDSRRSSGRHPREALAPRTRSPGELGWAWRREECRPAAAWRLLRGGSEMERVPGGQSARFLRK